MWSAGTWANENRFAANLGSFNIGAEHTGLLGEQSEELLGHSQVRQPVVPEPGHVRLPVDQGPGSPDARITGGALLRRVRIQRAGTAVELLPVQPPGARARLSTGGPSPHGGSAQREEKQMVHISQLAHPLLHPVWRPSLLSSVGTLHLS